MAAPQENLLPLGQLMGTDRNTFPKQRDHRGKNSVNKQMLLQADFSALQSHQNLRVTHLQQRWQELKERELAAQQYNNDLLRQFEKAQDTLREMLAHNTAMKTIRMEYERYLKEKSPHWQQQLKEKTQAARTLRMGDSLRSCLNNTEEHVRKSSAHQHLRSQGRTKKPQNIAATQEYNSQNTQSDNNQDGSSHLPYILSSWLTHPQSHTARFPIRVPYQPQGSSYVPPSYLPPPLLLHPYQPHHLVTSTPSHHQLWPRQDAPCWASPQTDCPWSWTAGAAGPPSGSEALWGQLYMEEPPPESLVSQVVAQEVETSRAASSKSGGSRSSHLSQELDIKPVRLLSGHTENSESGSDSSQIIIERMQRKRENRGTSQCTSSEKERQTSQECLGVCKEDTGSRNEESQCLSEESTSENSKNQSADNKSESGTEGSRGTTIQPENGARNEIKKQESSSSEQSSADEKEEEEDHEKNPGGGDGEEDNAEEKKDSQTDEELEEEDVEEYDTEVENSLNEEEQVEKQEEDGISVRKNTFEEEESAGVEECKDKDRKKNINCEERKQSSASSQDEDELQRDKNKTEEDEEEDGEGEQRRVKAGEPEEESDSEDSIISPQENRFKMMHIIPEEGAEDDIENKGSKTGSFEDDDSNDFSEDDIENVLAPQEQTKKGEKELKATEKPKAISDSMKIFQVEDDRSTKPNHQSDSDESDHFYD